MNQQDYEQYVEAKRALDEMQNRLERELDKLFAVLKAKAGWANYLSFEVDLFTDAAESMQIRFEDVSCGESDYWVKTIPAYALWEPERYIAEQVEYFKGKAERERIAKDKAQAEYQRKKEEADQKAWERLRAKYGE